MSASRAHNAPWPRILFACGGTGGHVYPAIAIADAVRKQEPGAEISFIGTRDRMEWEAVPRAGYPIFPITVSGFQRELSAAAVTRNLSFPFKLFRGFVESLRLVRKAAPHVVVGTGGYVAGPVGLAAAVRGRPLVIQEQNAYAGATNKLLGRYAERIFVAFDESLDYYPRAKTEVAGNPVRADLLRADRAEALAYYEVPEDGRVLLVMGGSLGAAPINEVVQQNVDRLLGEEDLVVIWQTGSRYFDRLKREVPVHPRLRLMPFLDRMDLAYAVANLVVCRSGAITCSELAATGTPSVLVPSPNVAADHQTLNARAMSDAGAAELLPETELTARFLPTVQRLLASENERDEMTRAARTIARPNAAAEIAEHIVELARGGNQE